MTAVSLSASVIVAERFLSTEVSTNFRLHCLVIKHTIATEQAGWRKESLSISFDSPREIDRSCDSHHGRKSPCRPRLFSGSLIVIISIRSSHPSYNLEDSGHSLQSAVNYPIKIQRRVSSASLRGMTRGLWQICQWSPPDPCSWSATYNPWDRWSRLAAK